jgi:hypothetical protein
MRALTPVEPRTLEGRDDLIAAIAELDLRHEAGEISSEQWAKRRAELKSRVAEHQEPEPAT